MQGRVCSARQTSVLLLPSLVSLCFCSDRSHTCRLSPSSAHTACATVFRRRLFRVPVGVGFVASGQERFVAATSLPSLVSLQGLWTALQAVLGRSEEPSARQGASQSSTTATGSHPESVWASNASARAGAPHRASRRRFQACSSFDSFRFERVKSDEAKKTKLEERRSVMPSSLLLCSLSRECDRDGDDDIV